MYKARASMSLWARPQWEWVGCALMYLGTHPRFDGIRADPEKFQISTPHDLASTIYQSQITSRMLFSYQILKSRKNFRNLDPREIT